MRVHACAVFVREAKMSAMFAEVMTPLRVASIYEGVPRVAFVVPRKWHVAYRDAGSVVHEKRSKVVHDHSVIRAQPIVYAPICIAITLKTNPATVCFPICGVNRALTLEMWFSAQVIHKVKPGYRQWHSLIHMLLLLHWTPEGIF